MSNVPMTRPEEVLAVHDMHIGHSTTWVELDDGRILMLAKRNEFRTSVDGVFAAGDVRAGSFRQIACAVGEGAQAYRNLRAYLEQGA